MNRKSSRLQDIWISVGLLALTFLTRIPFCTKILYHWDSVNFAYAMREFSVAKEQPQAPGYIVYVWLCRLVDLLFNDAQTTMVWISVIASALAVAALFCLGRSMFDRRIGLITALFLATSPLIWFYGEIALPHILDTLLVIVSAWWLYEVMQGNHRYLYPAITVMAIAGGVRQQTLIFLAPMLLFALRRVGWKRFLVAGILGAMICLAWFVPLMIANDGFSNYMRVMGEFSRRFQSTTSVFMGGGWWGVMRNLIKLTLYSAYGWGTALIPAVMYGIARLWRREWPRQWEKPIFLLLWIVPALVFYSIIHMGQQGLVFVFLPALLLFSAAGLTRMFATRSRWLIAGATVLLALNAGIFCLAPEYPLGPDTQRFLTRATLVNSDRYYRGRFEAIEENFAPASTAILAANWHHVEYYLPDYERLPFGIVSKWEQGAGNPTGNRQEVVATPTELGLQLDIHGQAAIIVFDPHLMAFSVSPTSAHGLPLEYGGNLEYFTLTEGQAFHYGATSFGIVREEDRQQRVLAWGASTKIHQQRDRVPAKCGGTEIV